MGAARDFAMHARAERRAQHERNIAAQKEKDARLAELQEAAGMSPSDLRLANKRKRRVLRLERRGHRVSVADDDAPGDGKPYDDKRERMGTDAPPPDDDDDVLINGDPDAEDEPEGTLAGSELVEADDEDEDDGDGAEEEEEEEEVDDDGLGIFASPQAKKLAEHLRLPDEVIEQYEPTGRDGKYKVSDVHNIDADYNGPPDGDAGEED